MTDLFVGARPRELVPGVPEEVEALADRLGTYSDQAGAAADRLRAIDSGSWVGAAGDAFRDAIGEVPAKLRRAGDAFWDAAGAVRAYADTLRRAQATAATAIDKFTEAHQQTQAWDNDRQGHEQATRAAAAAGGTPPPGPAPPATDPGQEQRETAQRLLDDAREEVEEAARRAEGRLREAAQAAPNEPGLLDKALGAVGDFLGGVVEGTVGLATFVFKLTTIYALIDPEGYVENLTGLAKGIAYGVTHPVEFAKAVSNWEMWKENPARALGQLVPELALALATGGAGAAGKAAGAARRLAGSADELADVGRVARSVEDFAEVGRLSRADVEEFATAAERAAPGYKFPPKDVPTNILKPGEAWAPDQGTPVIGRLADTKAMEGTPGHVRIDETIHEWSLAKNDAWIQSIINQKGEVHVASGLEGNLWHSARAEPTVTAREVVQLTRSNYVWRGDRLVPGP